MNGMNDRASNRVRFFTEHVGASDPKVAAIMRKELVRMTRGLELIPSENIVSSAVLEALGSVLTNKYSEGYARRRYYGGNQHIDTLETLAIERTKTLFSVPHANVQPYSGSPANTAVYLALCQPGDVIMGQALPAGGHLTHGWKVSISGRFFKSVQYGVRDDGYIDLEQTRALALEHQPKLIWCGATAYSRELPFEAIGRIADEVGAVFAADISHVSGLVIGNVHPSPVPYAHVVTTTTHKTLRGPRGAIIMVTQKGLERDPELADKLDRAVFPGLQGGPHDHQTAAIAVALGEAMQPEFMEYAAQIVKNAKALAEAFIRKGIRLVTGGTDNHMMLIDITPFGNGKGIFVQEALDLANLTTNKNAIPGEPVSMFYPSGLRLGTPAVTTRGLVEDDMELVADWIVRIINEVASRYNLPEDKTQLKKYFELFRSEILRNIVIQQVREEVAGLCERYPIYPEFQDSV